MNRKGKGRRRSILRSDYYSGSEAHRSNRTQRGGELRAVTSLDGAIHFKHAATRQRRSKRRRHRGCRASRTSVRKSAARVRNRDRVHCQPESEPRQGRGRIHRRFGSCRSVPRYPVACVPCVGGRFRSRDRACSRRTRQWERQDSSRTSYVRQSRTRGAGAAASRGSVLREHTPASDDS